MDATSNMADMVQTTSAVFKVDMLSTFIAFGQVPLKPKHESVPAISSAYGTLFVEFHDHRIRYYLSQRPGEAVRTWALVNAITSYDNPRSEAQRRVIVRTVLERLKILLRFRAILRAGREHIYLPMPGTPAPAKPVSLRPKRHHRRLAGRQVSAHAFDCAPTVRLPMAEHLSPSRSRNAAADKGIAAFLPTSASTVESPESKSASTPAPQVLVEVSPELPAIKGRKPAARIRERIAVHRAAVALARRERGTRKKWTGFLSGERFWRGRRVVMPNGEDGAAYFVNRGRVLVVTDEICPVSGRSVFAFKAHQLRPFKLPEAVLLGSRKAGRRERPSAKKTEACRLNAVAPPRPGSRPRGRPRTILLRPESQHAANPR